jgi:hypothetical protein
MRLVPDHRLIIKISVAQGRKVTVCTFGGEELDSCSSPRRRRTSTWTRTRWLGRCSAQRSACAACRSASLLAEEDPTPSHSSEPEFFDGPTVKLQQIMTAGATQHIDHALRLFLTFHRDINDVLSFAQRLFMVVESGSLVRR